MFQAGFLHLHNCRSLSWLQVGLLGFAEVRERLRQLVLVIANTCGEKAGEITEVHGSCAGCWLHPWQNLLSLLQRQSLWTVISSAARLLIILSAFLPCSKLAQYVSALPICLRWNQTGILCSAQWGWGSQVVHLILRFLAKGAPSWGVLSWCWTIPSWGMGWSRQSSHLPFFLVHLFSGLFVCFTGLLILPKWAPEVFWSYFFVHGYWSDCWSLWGHVEAGFFNVAFCPPSKLIQEIKFWNTFITPLKFYIS